MQCHNCIHYSPGHIQTLEEPGELEHCDVADGISLCSTQSYELTEHLQDLIRGLHLKLSELNNCPQYRPKPSNTRIRITPSNPLPKLDISRLEPHYSPTYHPE